MPEDTKTKPIQIPAETHKRFKTFCADNELSMGELASELIKTHIEGWELVENKKRRRKHV